MNTPFDVMKDEEREKLRLAIRELVEHPKGPRLLKIASLVADPKTTPEQMMKLSNAVDGIAEIVGVEPDALLNAIFALQKDVPRA